MAYTRGLHEVADGVLAWLQPDGGWGWSNAGLIVDGSSSLLVDTLFDLRLTAEMLSAMRAAAPGAEIGTVVNTHANGDHCYGNALLPGARIIASAAAAEEMAHVPPSRLAELMRTVPPGSYVARIFGAFDFEGITLALPTSTFSGSLSLTVGSTAVELVELGPAHTAGDIVAVVPSRRALFAGDLLFIGGHPIVWTGPISNWVAALDRILAMDVDTIVPGHGPVTDKAGVRELRDYFVALEAGARPLYEEGLTPLEAARRLHGRLGQGWGEAERLVVNVAACYRGFGAESVEIDAFADMEALAAS